MKLSRALTLLALCATSVVFAAEPAAAAADPIAVLPGGGGSEKSPTKATSTHTTATTTTTTTTAAVTTTEATTVHSTTTQATSQATTATATHTATTGATTVPKATTTTAAGTTATTLLPTTTTDSSSGNTTDGCINSSTCATGLTCVAASANATYGSCVNESDVCPSSPLVTCVTHADCNLAFSFCSPYNGQHVCTGMGLPGTASQCNPSTSSDSGLMTTVKYAGIAVGSVAVFGVLFALVRWQRRRQRSKNPGDMFGEIDYGMGASKGVESYPFSNRPNAHGSDYAPSPHAFDYNNNSNNNNNQYYEEPIGYSNKMQQDQYYGGYGYDQHAPPHSDNGFYDNPGYDEYPNHGHDVAAPPAAARAMSPRQNFNQMDGYGPESSELDFGGHGGHGHGGQGAYGGHY
ncbi:hypothetical protein BGX21_003207 [Mortierella sp. AD011]|nr:hypothetical protein BGX20_003270 [Mortierella sp. AD010]KAF9400912.1 hypothetical protein BGX21_003207 [Mortierella sp. AD011]